MTASRTTLCLMVALILSMRGWAFQSSAVPPPFVPVYFELGSGPRFPSRLFAFPVTGGEAEITLPRGLPEYFELIQFSGDGKAIYGQAPPLRSWDDGIIKIEFQPPRQSLIRVVDGVGRVSSVIVSKDAGLLIVSGDVKTGNMSSCGVFEIDPNEGTHRKLWSGVSPDCWGFLSPDGKRLLYSARQGNRLQILDLDTGEVHVIGPDMSWAGWSPDGKRIAAIQNSSGARRIVVIDSTNLSQKKYYGSTSGTRAAWSPDSKLLLVAELDRQCGTDFFLTLGIMDLETGKKTRLKSSACKIRQPSIGWMAPEALDLPPVIRTLGVR